MMKTTFELEGLDNEKCKFVCTFPDRVSIQFPDAFTISLTKDIFFRQLDGLQDALVNYQSYSYEYEVMANRKVEFSAYKDDMLITIYFVDDKYSVQFSVKQYMRMINNIKNIDF